MVNFTSFCEKSFKQRGNFHDQFVLGNARGYEVLVKQNSEHLKYRKKKCDRKV